MTSSLIQSICQAIVDKKGTNVLAIDVRGLSTITDYFVIAEGTVDRHIQAIAQSVKEVLGKEGIFPTREEGLSDSSGWIVLDYSEVLVHIFTHEMRMRYSLEEVWKEGPLVDLHLSYGA